jgi:hypothetical protein
VKNTDLAYQIEEAYDLIHSSPAKSNDSVKQLEIKVQMAVHQIEILIENDQEIRILKFLHEIMNVVNERNRILNNLN